VLEIFPTNELNIIKINYDKIKVYKIKVYKIKTKSRLSIPFSPYPLLGPSLAYQIDVKLLRP